MKKTSTKFSKKAFTLKTHMRLILSGLLFFTGIFQQALYAQLTYTFVTAGATGTNGPTQAQLNAAYAATNLSGAVVSTGGIQTWTVPVTGLYQIVANGAQGGGATGNGGLGASMSGRVNLTAGQVLQIVVGQRGTDATGGPYSNGGGGGGGSFVTVGTNTLLIAAGGGGGGGDFGAFGDAGVTTTDGTSESNMGGGTNGNGGQSGLANGDAAGGGGFLTNGYNTLNTAQVSNGGLAFVNGATGGMGGSQSVYYSGDGGFGGGGGGWNNSLSRSGGGGGYSGGQGGTFNNNSGGGGGGGSFNAGTDQINTQGVQMGDGEVVITYVYFATISQTNAINCYGNSTAALSVAVTGGNGPYTYTWSPSGGNANTATNLSAGVYTVAVTDAASMITTSTYTVTEPAALVASSTAGTILCNGGVTTVTVTETGGTSPFTNDGVMTNVAAGSYTYTVTDANSCASTTTITITEPAALVASSTAGTILCNGGVTTVTVTETGGTSPFTNDGVMTNVSAGSHTYTVTDANSCASTTTITITEPAALVASSTAGTILCNGGVTTVTVTETGGTSPFTNDGVMTNVSAGSHTYTVTDANSCASTTTITITEPAALVASSTAGTILCNGGVTTVTVTETGGTSPFTNDGVMTNVSAGSYTYTVTDANSCASTTTITITEPTAITGSQSFTLCAGGSVMVGANTYTTTGSYTDILTSAAGCDSTVTTNVLVKNAVDASVSVSGTTITSNETTTGATYQWVDCSNGNTPISGQTSQSFTATANGNYAVIVSVASCSVTSSCTNITNAGIERNNSSKSITIYPNPSTGIFIVQSNKELGTVEVFDVLGRSVYSSISKDTQLQLNLEDHTPGVYYIHTNGSTFKIVKQ